MEAEQEREVVQNVVACFVAGNVVVPGDAITLGAFAETLAVESVLAIRTANANVDPATFGQWVSRQLIPADSPQVRASAIAKGITIASAAATRIAAAFDTLGIEVPPPVLAFEEGRRKAVDEPGARVAPTTHRELAAPSGA